MIPAVIIAKKRDAHSLSTEEIRFMILGYARNSIPDYQMSALAMAIYLNGMVPREIADLTDAMIASGDRLQRTSDKPRVDKHSTGGLGDKTSLILAPLLACFDLEIPMISGRGLGITGGTLDKLEAIRGFRTNLSLAEIDTQLRSIGCVITGATDTLVPADKRLYALRDVTATVPSIPLITASIMSKKIAESLDALVLDVKFGSGAFLATEALAEQLAHSLQTIGTRAQVDTRAMITDMTRPLGDSIGNACEVDESIDILRGGGSAPLRELTIELAARLLIATHRAPDLSVARSRLRSRLDDGSAMERFERMVHAQGGDLSSPRPLGRSRFLKAARSGYLGSIDGQRIGQAMIAMGGGRQVAGERIDFSVGIRMRRHVGDPVDADEAILEVYCDSDARFEAAARLLESGMEISDEPLPAVPLWRDL